MKRFAILLILALLLTGCAAAPAQESTAPSTTLPAKTEPVTTTPSTAPVTEPATEPATEPPTEPAEPYDTYFATEIPIIPHDDGGENSIYYEAPSPEGQFPTLVSNFLVSQYGWKSEDLGLPALSVHDAKTYRTIGTDVMAEVHPATLSYCVAVSEDRGTLLRLSYTEGVEPVTLYTDPHGRISSPKVYDQCLFFVAGVDETTNGIYRYYLPDGTVDLLVKDLPTAADFLATDEPERRHQYEDVLEFLLYQGNGKYSVHYYYENFLTGETLEAYGYMRRLFDDYYYPDGTMRPQEEYSNGMLWWLDSYYQK